MYIVTLTKQPIQNDFRDGFFPRKFMYKLDALKLKREVEAKGGEAKVKKEK